MRCIGTTIIAVTLSFFGAATGPVSVSAAEELIIGNGASVLHGDLELTFFGKKVFLDPLDAIDRISAGEPLAIDVDTDTLERLTGLTPNPFVVRRSSGLKNGFALMRGSDRLIVFDPIWYSYGMKGGGEGSPLLVLAHEAGHHMCGHTKGKMRENPWAMELEADRYAGAALRRLGVDEFALPLQLMHARQTYAVQGSSTHPPQASRIQAIQDGYRYGSSC